MPVWTRLVPAVLAAAFAAGAADTPVFKSDVSLVRVDAEVVDRDNRVVSGLDARDFVLLEDGRPQQIRNFAAENMPLDLLLLLDVSRSMRPHVERIASAADEALTVLGANDRVAIMVFDRSTRVRLPFGSSHIDVEHELDSLLRQESFDGGTDITLGLLDAAEYVQREARPDARRAIVIVTDDQTERDRDEAAVSRALVRANAVLSALIAPDAMRGRWGRRGGDRRGGSWPGGGWPGSGGDGPLGGIILGRRGPYGGNGPYGGGRRPGGQMGPHTHSAGTAEIARDSGGDSMSIDEASALKTTLSRIRERYTLNFYLPPGVQPGQERNIEVRLADAARQRYPGAEVHYRRVYVAPGPGNAVAAPTEITRVPAGNEPPAHRRAVNEPEGGWPQTQPGSGSAGGGWPRVGP